MVFTNFAEQKLSRKVKSGLSSPNICVSNENFDSVQTFLKIKFIYSQRLDIFARMQFYELIQDKMDPDEKTTGKIFLFSHQSFLCNMLQS